MDSRPTLRSRPTVRQVAAAATIALATVASSNAIGVLDPLPAPEATPAVQSKLATVPESHFEHYVALGDSFTSGPLIPGMRLDPLGCARSTNNYPSILAKRIGVHTVTDVSCGGARTDHLSAPQQTVHGTNPPQLDALTAQTDLVTLSIGGNDESVVSGMIDTCARLARQNPYGAPCRAEYTDAEGLDELEPRIDHTVEKIHKVLSEINRRAPQATVVTIGYPRIVPAQGFCPDELPFAYRDYAYVDTTMRELNRALQGSADRFGATYVDTYTPSRGHDPCASEPWVNGMHTDAFGALAYHPFRAAMKAVADLVQRAINAPTVPQPPNPPLPTPPTATPDQVRRLAAQLSRE